MSIRLPITPRIKKQVVAEAAILLKGDKNFYRFEEYDEQIKELKHAADSFTDSIYVDVNKQSGNRDAHYIFFEDEQKLVLRKMHWHPDQVKEALVCVSNLKSSLAHTVSTLNNESYKDLEVYW